MLPFIHQDWGASQLISILEIPSHCNLNYSWQQCNFSPPNTYTLKDFYFNLETMAFIAMILKSFEPGTTQNLETQS
jgi:hypothetical protein